MVVQEFFHEETSTLTYVVHDSSRAYPPCSCSA